ncbi:MAG: DUF692 domain-containing protein [Allopontixanthobacter sediminis]
MNIPSELPPTVGIGLKPQHYAHVLDSVSASIRSTGSAQSAKPGWVEVHPQNYFCDGGPPHRWLREIAQHFPVSFHSVGLSLGTASGVDRAELDRLAALCGRYSPASISDHLSWSGTASNRYPDLLPVPYTDLALDHFVAQVTVVQEKLGRKILVENPSRYLAFTGDEMGEVDFLHLLCERAGCGILFDINNVEVSATNLGFDPWTFVDNIDPALVGEIHLAGHAREEHPEGPLLIDVHGSPVSPLTWGLFERFVGRSGPKPVLIEWDTGVPEYGILMEEVTKAEAIMRDAGAAKARAAHAVA